MSIKSFFSTSSTGSGSKKRTIEDSESSSKDTLNVASPVRKIVAATNSKNNESTTANVFNAFALAKSQEVLTTTKVANVSASGGGGESAITESSSCSLTAELKDESWADMLKSEFSKPYFTRLCAYVQREYDSRTIFPPRHQVFNAFNWCSYDNVKVVIIGQDPYHGTGQAHGLAFSVARGVQAPPSLKNIYKVAQEDVGIPTPQHGCLEAWSRQGVLLLNTCLTVRSGEANSHQGQGWEQFTDEVIRLLNRKEHLVFLLWGKPAQAKCKNIDRKRHLIVQCSHPSPLGAYAKNEPFMQSKCFSRCNAGLKEFGVEPVSWTVPN